MTRDDRERYLPRDFRLVRGAWGSIPVIATAVGLSAMVQMLLNGADTAQRVIGGLCAAGLLALMYYEYRQAASAYVTVSEEGVRVYRSVESWENVSGIEVKENEIMIVSKTGGVEFIHREFIAQSEWHALVHLMLSMKRDKVS
ncbi:MAG: hypothetical protein JW909_12555 [Planctomycetes bacterium]|nr:hypothetical protein [Planctomycetota bacterium]